MEDTICLRREEDNRMRRTDKPTFSIAEPTMNIKVFLENGVYYTDGESATGKTYLCQILQEYQNFGYPVAGVTYTIKDKHPFDSEDLQNLRLVMLDRYDMYSDRYHKEIAEISKNAIVILDCKIPENAPIGAGMCLIILNSPSDIEVR